MTMFRTVVSTGPVSPEELVLLAAVTLQFISMHVCAQIYVRCMDVDVKTLHHQSPSVCICLKDRRDRLQTRLVHRDRHRAPGLRPVTDSVRASQNYGELARELRTGVRTRSADPRRIVMTLRPVHFPRNRD